MKELLTLKDFHITEYVAWKELEKVFGKREYKKFEKWMTGQTCHEKGVYSWDLDSYLNQIRLGLKNPIIYD